MDGLVRAVGGRFTRLWVRSDGDNRYRFLIRSIGPEHAVGSRRSVLRVGRKHFLPRHYWVVHADHFVSVETLMARILLKVAQRLGDLLEEAFLLGTLANPACCSPIPGMRGGLLDLSERCSCRRREIETEWRGQGRLLIVVRHGVSEREDRTQVYVA